jgi:hypothetical protein
MSQPPAEQSKTTLFAAASLLTLSAWFYVYLARGLWRDEGIIAWLSYSSLHDCVRNTFAFQPWLPLYTLLSWTTTHLLGFGDWQLRVLPVAATLGCVPIIHKIARRYGGNSEAGYMAVLFVVSSRLVAMHIAEARPYALIIFFSLAALLLLLKFIDEDSPSLAAAWSCCWLCALYCHFLSGAAWLCQSAAAIYLLRDKPQKRAALIKWSLFYILAALPALYMAVFPYGGVRARVYLDISKPWEMLVPLLPLEIAIGAAAGMLAAMLLELKINIFKTGGFIRSTQSKLLAATWIAPVVLIYLFSVCTPIHVFTHRYMLASMSAGAIYMALLSCHYCGLRARTLIVVGVMLAAFWRISLTQFYRPYENWKEAMPLAAAQGNANTVYFMASTLGESMDLKLTANPAVYDYLSSILTPYPLPKRPVLLPMVINNSTHDFCAGLIKDHASAPSIIYVTGNGQEQPDIFASIAAKYGFHISLKKACGSIWIEKLEK